ncbi:hypothetical protein GCM10007392_28540 [Saccharospirillum salsuginis]|uniref:Uncharacterized protein n=2 Tax=Saccharospirillum salsuginis TaxID=418750 RepID=A0A918KD63_9GAMM|nr:hypothetical protein GCM10007392_28540 [Saccharospirillum salsuginis]
MYPKKTDPSAGNKGTNHQNDDPKVNKMEKKETAKKSFLAFLGAVSKHKTRRRGNYTTLDRLARPEVRDELSLKGVAVLSDN